MTKLSTRLRHAMSRHGFLLDGVPAEKDGLERACRDFYEFCLEALPAEPGGAGYMQKPRPSQLRWERMENFGKTSFDELRSIVGGCAEAEPKKCFGVIVPAPLYYKLKEMAEKGQLTP